MCHAYGIPGMESSHRVLSISFQEEPGFRRMPIIRARATKKNAELNAELLN